MAWEIYIESQEYIKQQIKINEDKLKGIELEK